MKGVVFVNTLTGSIESLYIPSSLVIPEWMPNPASSEPELPEGCVLIEIPDTIVHIDAMKTQRNEEGGFRLINDDEKLRQMRSLALPHICKTRNELLALCDYTMMADVVLPEAKKLAWMAYRQALRDITQQDPLFVQWPSRPS